MEKLEQFLKAVSERIAGNLKYVRNLHCAAHDKIELLGQWGTLKVCLEERCTDLATALKIIGVMADRLESIATTDKSWISHNTDLALATAALAQVESILSGAKDAT